MKKFLKVTTPVMSTMVLATTISLCCLNNYNRPVSTKISAKSSAITNDTASGSAIFQNFNPKYLFAVFTDKTKFEEQQDGSYVSQIDFGYNMDYINAVYYYTSLYGKENRIDTGTSQPFGPILTDASTSPKNGFLDQWMKQTSFFSFYEDPAIRKTINEAISSGKLFLQPYGQQQGANPVFNRPIKNSLGQSFMINEYDSVIENDYWPNQQNLIFISDHKEDFGTGKWWATVDGWKNLIKQFDTLKWKQQVDLFGIGQYSRTTDPTPFACFCTDKDTTLKDRSLDYKLSQLFLTEFLDKTINLEPEIKGKPFAGWTVDTSGKSFKLDCLIDATKAKRQRMIKITVPKAKVSEFFDWCQQNIDTFGYKITSDKTTTLHYYSPFFDDLFVCCPEESLKQIQKAYPKTWGNKNYLPSHQFASDENWSTPDQASGKTVRPIETNFVAPYAVDYVLPTYHELILGDLVDVTVGGQSKKAISPSGYEGSEDEQKCYLTYTASTPAFPTCIPAEYQAFSKEIINVFLYSLTPSQVKNFFETGKLDTRIYKYDAKNKKYTDEVLYEMWGDLQVYRAKTNTLTDTEAITSAAPLFIGKKDRAIVGSDKIPREVIDNCLLSPGQHGEITISTPKCNISTEKSINFSFCVPTKYEEQEIVKVNDYKSIELSGFAVPFKMSPTLNKADQTTSDLYNDPLQTKKRRFRFSGERLAKTHLFETSMDRLQILKEDGTAQDSPQIFKLETIPEAEQTEVPLWPTVRYDEVNLGEPYYDPKHAGIEVKKGPSETQPEIDDNKLRIHYNFSPTQITDVYDASKKTPYYFAKAKVIINDPDLVVDYDYPDYTIQPKQSLSVKWSITSGNDIATIDESTGLLQTVAGKEGIVNVHAQEIDSSREADYKVTVLLNKPEKPTPAPKEPNPGELYIKGQYEVINQTQQYVQYEANNLETVYTTDDERKLAFQLGSSYKNLEASGLKAFGRLSFDWTTEETKNNTVIKDDSSAFEHFDILGDKYVDRDESGKITGFKPYFQIENNDDLKVNFKLVKESLTKESIKFGFSIYIYKEDEGTYEPMGSLSSDEGLTTIIPQVNPQEKMIDTWTDASGQQLSEKCFKHKGDTVLSSLTLDELYKSKHMTLEQFKSSTKFIVDITEPTEQIKHIELDKILVAENDDSVTYQLGVMDISTRELKEVWYTITYSEKLISELINRDNRYWTLTFKITQEFEDTRIGKLSLKYDNTGTASELAFDWYTGKPKSPEPTPPPGPDPDPETETWWTLGHIFGLVGTVAASVAIIMSITAIAKNRKAIKKKQEEELKHS